MVELTQQVLARHFYEKLPENHRRWYAGSMAFSLPHGGIAQISLMLGVSRKTIRKGAKEISCSYVTDSNDAIGSRIRRPGGGRKDLLVLKPEIGAVFDAVTDGCTAGNPMDETVKWVSMTKKGIAYAMAIRLGYSVSAYFVTRLLKERGFSRRKMSKSLALKQVQDRDAQFENIRRLREQYIENGLPVVSVDTKKKEMLGNFYREGRCYCHKSRQVNDHDFRSFSGGMVTPHGVYDIVRNEGYLTCGTTDHDTSAFNVDCIEDWWNVRGKINYYLAKSILILADGGGSNSSRSRVFREQLQELSDRIGVEIRVAHYPPYTSKWNPTEHRLFCHISRAWSGKVFTDASQMLIPAIRVTTRSGLAIYAQISTQQYEKGLKVSKSFLQDYSVIHDEYLGKWNYRVKPRQGSLWGMAEGIKQESVSC